MWNGSVVLYLNFLESKSRPMTELFSQLKKKGIRDYKKVLLTNDAPRRKSCK